jgi:hypothetical protein
MGKPKHPPHASSKVRTVEMEEVALQMSYDLLSYLFMLFRCL